MQHLLTTVSYSRWKMFAKRCQIRGSICWRNIFWCVSELFENMDDRDGVMFFMFLKLADTADWHFFWTLMIEAETWEGFLCVGQDRTRWVFDGERIHKRINFVLSDSKYKYNIYESKEIGLRRSIKNKSSCKSIFTQKNKLTEMVYEAKKRILQGNLTVLCLTIRKHMISYTNLSQRKRKN